MVKSLLLKKRSFCQTRYANVKYRVAYGIGEKINISGGTVMKYNVYASSMNVIFDHSEEFALRILLGKTRVSHENVVELSRLSSDEIRNVSRSVLTDNISHLTFSDISHEVKYGHTQQKASLSRRERKELKETKSAEIRKCLHMIQILMWTVYAWRYVPGSVQ